MDKHRSTIEVKLTAEELIDAKVIFDNFWKEDIEVRQNLLIKWRQLKFMWDNIANTWYNAVAHDWRVWDGNDVNGNPIGDQAYYDNRINVFRAYLESIIAALSVTVPPVKCYPDDAENSSDIETAKAGDKIAELIYRHNDAPLLWVNSLFKYMTEGFVVAHTTADYKKEYGVNTVHNYDEDMETHEITTCPSCQFEIDNVVIPQEQLDAEAEAPPVPPIEPEMGLEQPLPEQSVMDEQPEEMDFSGLDNPEPGLNDLSMNMGSDICPSCNNLITPVISRQNEFIKVWVGSTEEAKGRVKNCAYGGLNIKIPLYATTQENMFYLYYAFEEHFVQSIEQFPDLFDDLQGSVGKNAQTGYDTWEQWARLSTEYRTGSYPVDNVTNKTGWFKPAAYNILKKDRAKHWHKKFPKGICFTFINETFACAKEQVLDEHWTVAINPLASYLQNDPMAMLLISVQEIVNDIVSLTKQTMEHGVGLTFVDPQFIDLNAYGQTEVSPGSLIPTKTISGNRKLQDGIYEVKTATLSGEVLPFLQQIQSLGQLVSGALPALFGEMNSETAAQDAMSKNQAVARLGNIWKMISMWWKNTYGKAIPLYISLIQSDERDVKRRKDGSFINVLIRRAELAGKIGKVELEANENIPLTWSQRKDVVMQLLLSPNPQLLQMLLAPENLDVLREAIGINGFYVIGEDDRDKQYVEITALLNSTPIPSGNIDPMTMQPEELPSVEVDEIMDNHVIQFEICRKWAVSEAGQLAKIENEPGYRNVLLHAKQHLMILNMGQPTAPQDAGNEDKGANPNSSQTEPSTKDAPNTGVVNVNQ